MVENDWRGFGIQTVLLGTDEGVVDDLLVPMLCLGMRRIVARVVCRRNRLGTRDHVTARKLRGLEVMEHVVIELVLAGVRIARFFPASHRYSTVLNGLIAEAGALQLARVPPVPSSSVVNVAALVSLVLVSGKYVSRITFVG